MLVMLGQDPDVVDFASQYIRMSWLAVLPYGIYCIIRRYLQNQNITLPLMVSGVMAVVTNVVMFTVTTVGLDMGFMGIPVAFVASNWIIIVFPVP